MKKILFFGELPPNTIHGASISNQINLSVLNNCFDISVVEEYANLSSHEKLSIGKYTAFIKSFLRFLAFLLTQRHHYFYSVIYLSTYGILKNILACGFYKLRNRRGTCILHFHRSDFDKFINNYVNQILFKTLDQFVDKYIVLSQAQLSLSSIDNNKKFLLHNTIDERYSFRRAHYKKNERLKAVYIGNYLEKKGFFDLIDAVGILYENDKNVNLCCYGNFTTIDVNKKLEDLRNKPFLTLNKAVLNEEKFSVIANADVLILPSHNEGVPLVLLEAMYIGTPIIITPVGYITEILGDEYPLYCDVKNPHSIVECMKSLNISNHESISVYLKERYKLYSNVNHNSKLIKIFK